MIPKERKEQVECSRLTKAEFFEAIEQGKKIHVDNSFGGLDLVTIDKKNSYEDLLDFFGCFECYGESK
jgi:hypothetical protein